MGKKFEVDVTVAQAAAVAAVVDSEVERSELWWRTELEHANDIADRRRRRERLAELRQERNDRRARGEHFDNGSAVLLPYLRAELADRGWLDRDWSAVQYDEDQMSGRRWGVEPGSRGYLDAVVRVNLPVDLADLLTRACWHVSAPATVELQKLAEFRTLSEAQLAHRDRLRSQIVTSGDVVRAALNRVIAASRASAESS